MRACSSSSTPEPAECVNDSETPRIPEEPPTMCVRRRLPSALFPLGLWLGVSTATLADEVTLVPGSTVKATGSRVRGTIQSESPTEVRVDGQAIPVDQIASVSYT